VVHLQAALEEPVLKIGIVTQSYYPKPGGVTEVAYHTAAELRRRGHHVTIITTRYGATDSPESDITRIGRNILLPVNGAWVNVTAGRRLGSQLETIFAEGEFDIIQTHCPLVPTLPLLALTAAGGDQKIAGTFHATAKSNLAYRFFRGYLESKAQRLDRRIAVSEPARRFANQYFPGHYEIVPNGVDCERFHSGVEPLDHFADDALNILYVGRMDRRKGLPYLFKALSILQKRSSRRIRLILVGEGKLRRMFMRRPVILHGAEIVAAGRVPPDELPRYFTSADIFCSPATGQESFGIVLLEAMASGLPVVASDIDGFRRVVSHGEDGLLAANRDPESIAQALLELGSDRRARLEMGIQGRKKALGYSWPLVTDTLERIFLDMLGAEPARATPGLVGASAR
jgi:phosphatidylinositol alpha-mannosyltransferase